MTTHFEALRKQFEAAEAEFKRAMQDCINHELDLAAPDSEMAERNTSHWDKVIRLYRDTALSEGCVVVPVEPTFEMLRDGRCFADNARDVFISMCLAASKEEAAKGEK